MSNSLGLDVDSVKTLCRITKSAKGKCPMATLAETSTARLVPALSRGLDVLEIFLRTDEPQSASNVVDRLGLPRTTVHELLNTLLARDYLRVSQGDVKRFTLGPLVLQLGQRYHESLRLHTEAQRVAEELMAQCGETVHVAMLEGNEVFYLLKVDSPQPVRMVSALGTRVPAHATAVGKVLLAHLPDQELSAAVSLTALTPRTITDLQELRRQLAQCRAQGWAEEFEESNADAGCIAAPVHDHDGPVVAAISISAPSSRHTDANRERWRKLVVAAAAELSHRLGYLDRSSPKRDPNDND
jgi:IclR family KDG regulon transcriptional repressor